MKGQPSSSPKIADLNADGWLDLIFGGGWAPKCFGRPTQQAILVWEGARGFSTNRTTRLQRYDSLEQVVADPNTAGHLDIVMTNYHACHTRTLPAFVYWGPAGSSYSDSHRTSLPDESSSALMVADRNQDSWMDLVVFKHLARGDHSVGTNIYWGGKTGYSYSRRHWIRTFGPHFGQLRVVQNIYDRRLQQQYISTPLKCPNGKNPGRIRWNADIPHQTQVKFQVHGASSNRGLKRHPGAAPRVPTASMRNRASPSMCRPEMAGSSIGRFSRLPTAAAHRSARKSASTCCRACYYAKQSLCLVKTSSALKSQD